MTTPPTVQTPPYKPNKPSSPTLSLDGYITPYTTQCHFTLPTFLHVLKDLTLHPERNSSLILRADPIPLDTQSQVKSLYEDEDEDFENWILGQGMEKVEDIRVRLMPKQPKRDGKLDQRVLFYRSKEDEGHEGSEMVVKGVVVMIPLVKNVEEVPFFHPPVRKLVFHYQTEREDNYGLDKDQVDDQVIMTEGMEKISIEMIDTPEIQGRISVSYLPFPSTSIFALSETTSEATSSFLGARRTSLPRKRSPLAGPAPPLAKLPTNDKSSEQLQVAGKGNDKVTQARLDRTCLALLERVYKHGFGQMVGYKKRVNHDTVVKREPFQDLYLILKDRHRHLDSREPKAGSTKIEDVKRHVWKNILESSLPSSSSSSTTFFDDDISEWASQDVAIAAFLMLLWKDMYPVRAGQGTGDEWDTWGRPENGFIDLGCGNGLLVHILISEGYVGKGYELRARRTWPLYPPKTQAALVEAPLDPPSWFPTTVEEWRSGSWSSKASCVIENNTFLIGNHADELTPWLPLLSLLPTTPVPHLSLPCCLHKWDSPFMHANYKPPLHPHTPEGNFEQGLEAGQSRYKSYLMWLGWVGLQCGWKWETEPLRIPSTRGWGIVARNRWADEQGLEECRAWALEQVLGVRERGAFKIRVKEGKEH